MITSVTSSSGVLNVFVVGPARQTIWDTWSRPGENTWNGGQEGKQIAGLRRFAEAPEGRTIRGINADLDSFGSLMLFVTLDDGSVMYTWQAKGGGGWWGSQPGRIAALGAFAPKP